MSDETTDDEKRERGIVEVLASFSALRKLGRLFWTCNAIYFFDAASYFGMLMILTLFLGQSLGMSDRWSGITVAYFTGALTILSTILGGVIDRLGVKKTLLASIVLAAIGRGLLTLAPALPLANPLAFVALTLMAASAGMITTAVYAGVKQSTTPETSAIGFSLVYALLNGGSLVAALFSSPMRARFGPVGVFWGYTALTLVCLFLQLFVFPKSAGAPVVAPPKPKDAPRALRSHPLADARFLFFITVLLGVRTLFAHQWLTMPDYVTRAYAPEVGARFEWINGLNPFIILFGTPIVAALTRRVHVVKMMIIGTLVSAAASFLLAPGPSLAMLITYEILFSIGEALWSSRFYEWVAQTAPPDKVGVYMGVATIPWFVAKFTTGLYSGAMLEAFCPKDGAQHTGTMWIVYGCIGMTSPIGLILARRWLVRGMVTKEATAPAAA
jgi:MFS family permease